MIDQKYGNCSLLLRLLPMKIAHVSFYIYFSIKAPRSLSLSRLSSNHSQQYQKMFLTNPSWLETFLLLLSKPVVEAEDLQTKECCAKKMVGNVSYTLLPGTFHGELPSQCLNGCVYTVSGTSSPKFCFAKGLPAFVSSDRSSIYVMMP